MKKYIPYKRLSVCLLSIPLLLSGCGKAAAAGSAAEEAVERTAEEAEGITAKASGKDAEGVLEGAAVDTAADVLAVYAHGGVDFFWLGNDFYYGGTDSYNNTESDKGVAAGQEISERPTAVDGAREAERYREYQKRFGEIEYQNDIAGRGFRVIEDQIFPIEMAHYGEVSFIPAMDEESGRLVFLFAASDGEILYKTEQLAANNWNLGQLDQPNQGISAVSFQDLNGDGRMDIVLITSCANEEGDYAGKMFKVGDVLFQDEDGAGFYQDYRISDKINRFNMNKSIDLIVSFVRDGNSTEFLYTAATLDELLDEGLRIITEQCYFRDFEKLGRLQVVPGVYRIADYDVFIIYLVNEQGYIVWSLQPMGEYDNLYALKGINCRDIDGDGLKDIMVLARYSYEGGGHELIVKSDYAIYYQRTGGFSADTEIKDSYRCKDEDTMEELVEKARAYWGWKSEK